MIRFSCPGCSSVFTVGDEKAGKKGKCPKCAAEFEIPEAEPTARAPAPQAPPPPPPPAPEADAEVEIKPCPGCQAKLSVATSDLGLDVECPYCKTVYKATKAGGTAAAAVAEGKERPSSRRRKDEDDDEEDDRPRRRRRRDDDDEEEEEERPRRLSRRSSRSASPSGAVTTVGILNFVIGGLGLICSCATILMVSMVADMVRNQPGPRGAPDASTIKTIFYVISVVQILFSTFFIVAGLGVVKRQTYGRIMTFVTASISILFGLLSIVNILMTIVAGNISGAVGGFIGLLIYGGYGIFAMITMAKCGDEFN